MIVLSFAHKSPILFQVQIKSIIRRFSSPSLSASPPSSAPHPTHTVPPGTIASFSLHLPTIKDANGTNLDIRWFNCSDPPPPSTPPAIPASDAHGASTYFVKLALITCRSCPPPPSACALFSFAPQPLPPSRFLPLSSSTIVASPSAPLFSYPIESYVVDNR
jgi:hypothetical protein